MLETVPVALPEHTLEERYPMAALIREALIPPHLPEIPHADIAVAGFPKDERLHVGGDFVDLFPVGESWAIVIGDVSGKGPDAAASAVMAKYMLRGIALRNPSPGSVMFHLNNGLCQTLEEERFVSLLYALYSPLDGALSVCSGGSWPPVVLERGSAHWIESRGGLLGLFPDHQFAHTEIPFAAGDVFFSYTDGVPEAGAGKHRFGIEPITRLLRQHAHEPEVGLIRLVVDAARDFAGGSFADDVLVLVMKAKGFDIDKLRNEPRKRKIQAVP